MLRGSVENDWSPHHGPAANQRANEVARQVLTVPPANSPRGLPP